MRCYTFQNFSRFHSQHNGGRNRSLKITACRTRHRNNRNGKIGCCLPCLPSFRPSFVLSFQQLIVHECSQFFIHAFDLSFCPSLLPSFNCSSSDCPSVCSFARSLARSFVRSLARSVGRSLARWLVRSFVCSFVYPFLAYSYTD